MYQNNLYFFLWKNLHIMGTVKFSLLFLSLLVLAILTFKEIFKNVIIK